mgnify:CR=1 FL=1
MEKFYFISFVILMTLLGICIGSFLNVVIYRLPNKMSLSKPPSHCTFCNHLLAWYDNIPLLSYIFLKGKCRYCHHKISIRYFLVEFGNGLLWTFSAFVFYPLGFYFPFIYACIFSTLLCIALIDYENMFIPDRLQFILFFLGVILCFIHPSLTYKDHCFGFLLGGCFFLFFYLLSYLVFKKEGLGFGDVKLMFCCGLILGFKNTIVSIVLSTLCALIYVFIKKILKKKSEKNEIPFAPFLVFGVIMAVFFGQFLMDWYFNFFF